MDDLIRAQLHDALDVEPPDGGLHSRIVASLPVDDTSTGRFHWLNLRWARGLITAVLAVAIVGGLLLSHGTLLRNGTVGPYLSATSPSPVAGAAAIGGISMYPLGPSPSFIGRITSTPTGGVWALDTSGPSGTSSRLLQVAPSGALSEYPVSGYVWDITAGPDGNVWFTEGGVPASAASGARLNMTAGRVGRVTPSGSLAENAMPTGAQPYGIAFGPDGNLWVTDPGTNQVMKVATSGSIIGYRIPTLNSGAGSITAASDGSLWFAEANVGKLARVTTSGTIAEFGLPDPTFQIVSIVSGPDGNLWVTERGRYGAGGPGKVAKVTSNGSFVEYNIPAEKLATGSGPFEQPAPTQIAVGADGELWFAAGSNIDSMTTAGVFNQYLVPSTADGLGTVQGVTSGPDRNIWFTVHDLDLHDYVGKLTLA